jgi:hypothetical protein
MSEYSAHSSGRVDDPASGYWDVRSTRGARTSAWAGWIGFAAIMMIIMGMFSAIEGLVALFNRNYYLVGPDNVLVFDLTSWGWIHLIFGILVTITGIALFSGATWARWVTVGLAAVDAVVQLAFIGIYPLWSMIVIAFCVIVIWAIVVHGDESRLDP